MSKKPDIKVGDTMFVFTVQACITTVNHVDDEGFRLEEAGELLGHRCFAHKDLRMLIKTIIDDLEQMKNVGLH